LDSEGPVDLIYLDFQKAFDKVAHERLLLKLESYGITGQVHDIIRNFLTGRSMAIRVGDHISSWEPVTSGVPKGLFWDPCYSYYLLMICHKLLNLILCFSLMIPKLLVMHIVRKIFKQTLTVSIGGQKYGR
jgi:hypothetical protein